MPGLGLLPEQNPLADRPISLSVRRALSFRVGRIPARSLLPGSPARDTGDDTLAGLVPGDQRGCAALSESAPIFNFYMGKTSPERNTCITDKLVVPVAERNPLCQASFGALVSHYHEHVG